MDFWGMVLSNAIALLIVAAITAVATFAFGALNRWWGRRADFRLRRDSFGTWTLKRVKRSTAFEVRYTVVTAEGYTLDGKSHAIEGTSDLSKGETVELPSMDGRKAFGVQWIDRSRKSSGAVPIDDTVHVYWLRAQRRPRLRLRLTR